MTDPRIALRSSLRQARRSLHAKDRIDAADAIAAHLLSLSFSPRRGRVAGYWATDGEIALHVWQMRLPAGVSYCLPVMPDTGDPEEGLSFAPWRPGEPLVTNRFGIPEPDVKPSARLPAEAMDLVVLPLVGFDVEGNRLGMGGGWYDRTFAFRRTCAAPPWLVGAAFSIQQTCAFEPQAWDVPLDAICTERSIHLPTGSR